MDRLRFEHEKRQSEVSSLQIQVTRQERDYDQIQDDWGDALKELEDRYGAERGIKMFDASGFQEASRRAMDRMSQTHGRLHELQEEMQAIEQVLDSKWK